MKKGKPKKARYYAEVDGHMALVAKISGAKIREHNATFMLEITPGTVGNKLYNNFR